LRKPRYKQRLRGLSKWSSNTDDGTVYSIPQHKLTNAQ